MKHFSISLLTLLSVTFVSYGSQTQTTIVKHSEPMAIPKTQVVGVLEAIDKYGYAGLCYGGRSPHVTASTPLAGTPLKNTPYNSPKTSAYYSADLLPAEKDKYALPAQTRPHIVTFSPNVTRVNSSEFPKK